MAFERHRKGDELSDRFAADKITNYHRHINERLRDI